MKVMDTKKDRTVTCFIYLNQILGSNITLSTYHKTFSNINSNIYYPKTEVIFG